MQRKEQYFEKEIRSDKEKIEKYKQLLNKSKAIFILDSDIKEISQKDHYRSTSYKDLDSHGFLAGGHARVIAAAEIGKYFPEVKLITTSYYQPDKPIHAEIYARELEKLSIPKNQIELEKKSTSTLTSLIEMVKLAKNHDWKEMSILTSDFHVPRTQEMYHQLKDLAENFNLADEEFSKAWNYFKKEGGLKISFIVAEEILLLRDSRYKTIIEEVKKTEAYKKRVESEKKGVKQLKEGTYGKKQ